MPNAPTPTTDSRAAYHYFNIVAVNAEGHVGHPFRVHYWLDCWQIRGNNCTPREATVTELQANPELCFSCVSRLAKEFETL